MTTISGLSGSIYSYYPAIGTARTAPAPRAEQAAQDETAAAGSETHAKPFAEVAADARAALDAGYERLGETGSISTTGDEWRDTVGLEDLDRRSLYAIASNEGGLFSDVESSTANTEMRRREADVLWADSPVRGLPTAYGFRSLIDYYDKASPEEKASFEWASSRAQAVISYESRVRQDSGVPENVASDSDVSNLLVEAWHQLIALQDISKRVEDMPSYRLAVEHWSYLDNLQNSISWTI